MDLTAPHWLYFVGILLIIGTMLMRKNVVVPAILMTFLVGYAFSGSIAAALQTIFSASLVAAGELFSIFDHRHYDSLIAKPRLPRGKRAND